MELNFLKELKIYYILILVGGCLQFECAFGKNVRIAGGTNADISAFPFQVSLRFFDTNTHHCGGTIVSKKHVVTAAHCVFVYIQNLSNFRVLVGTDDFDIIFKIFRIFKIDVHPNYTGRIDLRESMIDDISIITIYGTMSFNSLVNKAILPTQDLERSEIVTITGFGQTSNNSTQFSRKLQKTTMFTISQRDCSNALKRRINRNQSCIINKEGVGACKGDSGGPISINGVFVGILSFIVPCAKGYPDVIVKIYPYLNFINSIIGN